MSDAFASPNAEQEVIASCLLRPEQREECERLLRPEHFYCDANATVWKALVTSKAENTDQLIAQLNATDDYHRIGGAPYLWVLLEGGPYVVDTASSARHIRECHTARETILALREALAMIEDHGPGNVVEVVRALGDRMRRARV